ncbi:hypothetical protein LCGC14_1275230 [marine sediment metagenome]|uniref:Zinc transporter ZupT n=1 Tax=marine sediment metagenome TaxID=412755 RepID=A0A0F9LI63_9ZZZZ|nr:zinc transporter ZupT [bacterium]
MNPLFIALLLSTFAGLATTIGSLIAFFIRKPNKQALSFIMGFSCGVMLLISFVELLQQGIQTNGILVGMGFFLIGMMIMLLIDMKVSHYYEFEEEDSVTTQESKHQNQKNHLKKTSVLVALGVFIHNFPEGMATFIGTLKDIELGILITTAIALHNIPEGIVVAVTVSSYDDSKLKPILWSFLSGISEPIGALLVGVFLFPFVNDYLLGALLALVGGFMIYISLDELLPMSRSLGKEHTSILGIAAGMFAMSLSIAIL